MSVVRPILVQVFFHPEMRSTPNLNWELIEVDFPDLEQFLIAVSDPDRMISGNSLRTVRGEQRGVWIVSRREPIAFRGRAVDRAQLPSGAYLEVEE